MSLVRSPAGALLAYESRRRLRESLVVAAGMAVLAVMMVAFFPSVQDSGADLQAYVDSLPPAFSEAFGIEAFTTMGGFLAAELYAFGWVILLGLYLAYRGGGLVAADVETGRMDSLLAAPVSRGRVVVEAYASLLVPVVVVNVVGFVVVYAGVLAVGESIDLARLAMVHLLSVPYLLACGAIGLLLSVTLQRRGAAEKGGLGLAFGLFLAETVASTAGYDWVSWLAPSGYYDPTAILVRGEFAVAESALLLGVTAVLVALAVLRFRRADIR
ncbi:ABC transporter permease subunit [Halosegnis marinus]|uniref:ABC transporter permease subunit n=1 Tax=Halosegnis marinus TaxID=3034023 RepID=A0ABD5ZL76_9EURY|nr:ABC transporter permease subunit [Halosegnis sp. DT85]